MSSNEFVSTHIKSDTTPDFVNVPVYQAAERIEGLRQWTLKGLAPEIVEVSREAAKRSGMRLNAWVSRALEQAAVPQSATPCQATSDTPTASSDMVQRIQEEVLRLRAESTEMRKTVDTMSQILLKLMAEKI
jgi:hypothetical protein